MTDPRNGFAFDRQFWSQASKNVHHHRLHPCAGAAAHLLPTVHPPHIDSGKRKKPKTAPLGRQRFERSNRLRRDQTELCETQFSRPCGPRQSQCRHHKAPADLTYQRRKHPPLTTSFNLFY